MLKSGANITNFAESANKIFRDAWISHRICIFVKCNLQKDE